MDMSHPKRPEVFISYSHEDEDFLDELLKNLQPLKDRKLLDCWSDREIASGQLWRQEIEHALASAKVAVLMVSQNFLASRFIAENELPPLLKSAAAGDLTILWIPIRASTFEYTKIADFHAVHPPEKPLDGLRKSKRQQAFVEISKKILETVASRQADGKRSPPIVVVPPSKRSPSNGDVAAAQARGRRQAWGAAGVLLLALLVWAALRLISSQPPAFLPTDPNARDEYVQGLKHLSHYDHGLARRSFEAVLKAGEFPPARSALSEALLRLGYGEDAFGAAEKAFKDLTKVPNEEQRLQIEARYRRINAEWEQAIKIYEKLQKKFPENVDYKLGMMTESLIAARGGRKALSALEGLERNEKDPDPRLYLWQAWAANYVPDYTRQRDAATKAIEMVEGKKEYLQLEAKVHFLRGDALLHMGKLAHASSDFQTALKYYSQAYDRRGEAQAQDALAQVWFFQGRLNDAEKTRRNAREAYQRVGDDRGAANQRFQLANILSERGLFNEADKEFEGAIEEFDDDDARKVWARVERARTWIQAMKLEPAEKTLRAILKMDKDLTDKRIIAAAHKGLGEALAARGRADEALGEYHLAFDLWRGLGEEREMILSQLDIAEGELERGDSEEAARQLTEVFRALGNQGMPYHAAVAQALQTRVLLAQGKPPGEAREALKRAQELAGQSQFPAVRIKVELSEAEVLNAEGNRDAARRILEAALNKAAEFPYLAREARLALNRLGAKTGSRSQSS